MRTSQLKVFRDAGAVMHICSLSYWGGWKTGESSHEARSLGHIGYLIRPVMRWGIYVAQLEGACVVCEKTDLILGSQLIVQHLENQNDIQGHPWITVNCTESRESEWHSRPSSAYKEFKAILGCVELLPWKTKTSCIEIEHYVTEGWERGLMAWGRSQG